MNAYKYSRVATGLTLILASAGLAVGNPNAGSLNGDEGDAVDFFTGDRPGENNNPVSDETIAINQQLYEMREQIALSAFWVGPGPGNFAPLMADDDWLSKIRAISQSLQDLPEHRRRALFSPKGKIRPVGKTGDKFAPVPPTRVGFDDDGGNEAQLVVNLWQTYVTPDGRKARIPYTFSDTMIDAWGDRFDPDQDPEGQNAVAGIANTFAVMLLLEQYLPVRFEGFNPNVDEGSQILLMDNVGEGVFGPVQALNTVSRIGRARQITDDDLEPTTMTHCTWANFPSMVRSFGFVLGLDWEQRHVNRDTYIIVHPENYPPYDFPPPLTPNDGSFTQGLTVTGNELTTGGGQDLGPVLFDQNASITFMEDAGCDFDLDSMMLLDPYVIAPVLSTYTVREEYRFADLNGDGILDLTEGGPDDRVLTPPIPLFFSDCDIAQLTAAYTRDPVWYFGDDLECMFDINADEIQDGRDAALFLALYLDQDVTADIVPTYGSVDANDYDFFNTNFVIQSCVGPTDPPLPDDAPWFLGDDPECLFDLNGDQIQDGRDAALYMDLYNADDPRADITQPFGYLDLADLDFFNTNFAVQSCVGETDPDLPPDAPWFFGKNPDCPHDINEDDILDGADADLFTQFVVDLDPRADIVRPFGVVDSDDLTAFFDGLPPGIPAFAFGPCDENVGSNGWYYGRNPDCPYDINDDGVQNNLDISLFMAFYNSQDTRADLVPTFGSVDSNDWEAFSQGDDANDIEAFELQSCSTDIPNPDDPWYYGKNPDCPQDVNEDGIQDATDIMLFMELYEAQDSAADIFPDYGLINLSDLQVFTLGDDDGLIPHMPNGDQDSPRPPFIPGYCGNDGLPDPGNRPDRANPG